MAHTRLRLRLQVVGLGPFANECKDGPRAYCPGDYRSPLIVRVPDSIGKLVHLQSRAGQNNTKRTGARVTKPKTKADTKTDCLHNSYAMGHGLCSVFSPGSRALIPARPMLPQDAVASVLP